jgi:hypothetical protein
MHGKLPSLETPARPVTELVEKEFIYYAIFAVLMKWYGQYQRSFDNLELVEDEIKRAINGRNNSTGLGQRSNSRKALS